MTLAAPTIPPELPQKGQVLDGKYRIEEALGAGGMGIVVVAWHLLLNQKVAIKFLLRPAMLDLEAAERLVREARALGALRSEHATRVLDVGRLPSGAPYMVMEYLAGTHLGRLIRARGPLPVTDAVDCILQASEAIGEAHALGIVHRDLKPSNLYVIALPDRSLSVKVLDFGISKVGGSKGDRLTHSGITAGTPEYMAPEQMKSLKDVDSRADVWSLGVILFYLLTGRRPFDGKSMPIVYTAIVNGPRPEIRSSRPDVPPALEALVLRCLERDVSRRVQSVVELARGLAPFASARGRMSVEWILRAAGRPPG